MQTVVKVEGLCKAYRIGREQKRSDTIVSALWNGLAAPFQNFRNLSNLRNTTRDADTIFWALKDINFEVKKGEVLGIIGHNGAGKSTLLKILSRITEPTEGKVTIHGRVSSLLEVGTGFHPDLTGRENIYMNGTILGMRKREIDAKLDEIISFSGISQYIDTPVKRYSSGMSVRLAFSVAAHLEPEILIIDEVLAVGDADFQKKCVGKMNEVADGGRTILFVSHNLKLVESLCRTGIVLDQGAIIYHGSSNDSLNYYRAGDGRETQALIIQKDGPISFGKIIDKELLQSLTVHDNLKIRMQFNSIEPVFNFHCDMAICNEKGITIVHTRSSWNSEHSLMLPNAGDFELEYCIQRPNLAPGKYSLDIYIYSGEKVLLYVKGIEAFKVLPNNLYRGSLSLDSVQGFIVPDFTLLVK